MTALLYLLQSPLVWVFIFAASVMVATSGTRTHAHHFRRHPSGTWKCTGCPALRDRHGKEIR